MYLFIHNLKSNFKKNLYIFIYYIIICNMCPCIERRKVEVSRGAQRLTLCKDSY